MKQQNLRSLPPQPPCPMSSSWLLSVGNLRGRMSLIKEMRKAETKANSQRRSNNNNVVIKHSQGPLGPSQGLKIIF